MIKKHSGFNYYISNNTALKQSKAYPIFEKLNFCELLVV